MEDSIITETPTATADSETRTAVIRTIRETRTIVGSETKAMGIRTTRTTTVSEIPIVMADSEILKAADQNLPVVDSETAQAAKAPAPADSRAAEAALDKTIINKKTNS